MAITPTLTAVISFTDTAKGIATKGIATAPAAKGIATATKPALPSVRHPRVMRKPNLMSIHFFRQIFRLKACTDSDLFCPALTLKKRRSLIKPLWDNCNGLPTSSPLFEIARVLVRFDHVASYFQMGGQFLKRWESK
jgi:hypothetical protein